ncbi:peroxisomal membrane protein PEX14 [Citrus sinensis]|nr:peroxisomal membrane protein PEX14 [Citrus sinensis]
MATQSPPSPSSTAGNPPTLAAETSQQATGVQQDGPPEAAEQPISSPSVFVNSEPMREEQVQNAVKFLSHPKVRGSPVIYRRSFLEKKGLTKEEIDEAFRRVPDPPPSAQATSANQVGQVKSSSSNIQSQAPTQALQPQPAGAAPTAVSPVSTTMMSRFHWYHAVLAVGLLAASGAGTAVFFKKSLIPRLKSWIRKVVLEEEDDSEKKSNAKPSLAEEAAAAAKAAAAAASDVAKASQELLNSKNEERRYFSEFMNLLDVQLQEMKSMSNSIRKLEGQSNNSGRTSLVNQEDHRDSVTGVKQPYANGKADFDMRSVRSSSPPAAGEPTVAPHPKSYMEIMAMVQRGEKPPNIRDINDLPPNPSQQLPNPRLAPKAKPWEVGQAQNASGQVIQSQRKNVKITEVGEDEIKAGPYSVRTNEPPVQRTWVPPQPPPVVMPEAAEAIRRPKPSGPTEQSTSHQLASQTSEVTDELQRITKISEAGGIEEIKGNGSVQNSSEIQEEQETHA